MPPQNKPQNSKNHISPKKIFLGDLRIYPTSPSYSLTLSFIEATIFTQWVWKCNLEDLNSQAPLDGKCLRLLGDLAKFGVPVQ